MNSIISFLLLFLISFNILAQDSVAIEKGKPAPFDGIIMTTEKAQSIRKELIEKDQFKLFNETLLQDEVLYKRIIDNNKTQVKLLTDQNGKLFKYAEDSASLTSFEKMLWGGLGVVGTSLAVWGAGSLAK